MIEQHPSKIFRANFRGSIKTEKHSCLSTFNYEGYQDEHRHPFGNLQVVNDEILASNESVTYKINENQDFIIIPLIGAIDFITENDNGFLHINQIQIIPLKQENTIVIKNPYKNDTINFLQIRLKGNSNLFQNDFHFSEMNKLYQINNSENYKIITGIFNARNEGLYKLKSIKNGVFAFVINGAFEFQNRLIENRDSLCIWDIDEIEFEALAENSILLIIEVNLQ